jgi:Cu(I)/Ag(I) efflux system membrane fusion protein
VAADKIARAGPEGKDLELPEEMIYVCPMNCVPPMEKPGNCPVCGMELVAVSAEEHRHEEGPPRIALSDEKVRAAGIRVAPVERKLVTKEIRLFGKIEYDPVEQFKVTAFAPGIIDRIYVKRAGQTVRKGDPLFDMHSSELFVLEQELFEVLKEFPDAVDYRPARGQIYKRQMRPPSRQFKIPKPGEASKEEIEAKQAALEKLGQIHRKMVLLGLTRSDIDRVMARGLPSGISTVTTPTTGIVLEQYAFKGAYVNTGETIFTVASPNYIWARLEGYASDFPWIRLRQEAELETYTYPGEVFAGNVSYLDPKFDPKTRTFKVGVLFTDPKKRLRPNMLVRCVILSRMTARGVGMPGRRAGEKAPLVIPDSAPLITGNRAVVYVEVPGEVGTYVGREVVLGPRAKGYYVVKHGLKKGELVVVSGNFKIDSAVQILAKPSMIEPQGGMTMSEHSHSAETQPIPMERVERSEHSATSEQQHEAGDLRQGGAGGHGAGEKK